MLDILLVEDDVLIREMMALFLEDEGYEVAGVSNGQEALQYLKTAASLPRLILLDLNMPVMTGWKFRKRQQHDPVLNSIPVVIVSATANVIGQPHVVGEHIAKPVDFNKLISTVQRYCSTNTGAA